MSLDFDLSKIKDFESVCYLDEDYNPVTRAIIFVTMAVGIGSITEKNVDEFTRRLEVVQQIDGCLLRDSNGKPFYLNMSHVERHIGLTTNASNWTKRTFDSKMKKAAQDKAKRESSK